MSSLFHDLRWLRLNGAGGQRHFHFGNGPGDFNLTWAGVGAVEGGAAAPDAELFPDHVQPLVGGLVAGVEDKAVGLDDGRRADVLAVGPEAGAGGGAGGAQGCTWSCRQRWPDLQATAAAHGRCQAPGCR